MADKKISELNSLTGANAADGDLVAIVDVSATETKKITRSEFFTDTPNIDVTGTVTADGLTVDVAGTADIVFQRDNAVSGKLELDFASAFANFNSVNDGLTFSQNAVKALQIRGGDISFYEDTGTTPKMVWKSSDERLGIGTSSPQHLLHVSSSSNFGAALKVSDTASQSTGAVSLGDGLSSTLSVGMWRGAANSYSTAGNTLNIQGAGIQFMTAGAFGSGTERMRIDSSGNLLVGTTTSSGSFKLEVLGSAYINGDTRLKSTYPIVDNVYDVGTASFRWDDIFATNGTIQTSDRNEKQDIDVLSEAEQRVAVACKGLLRKFRWKDAVEEKGDDARIHFGIIAQDLQDAFEAEGLDAGRYAMFISSTWTDEETGEERSRMGVRYPQLLAFIIAAI